MVLVRFRFHGCAAASLVLLTAATTSHGFVIQSTTVPFSPRLFLAKSITTETASFIGKKTAPSTDRSFPESQAETAKADLTSLNEQHDSLHPQNDTSTASHYTSNNNNNNNNALDICRDFQGNALTLDYLAAALQLPLDQVASYSCPESEAFRGFMSNGCRIYIHGNDKDNSNENNEEEESFLTTAFYKRVAFSSLDHAKEKQKKAPFKLLRDIRSYHVVADFLQSQARSLVLHYTKGLYIPHCYHALLHPHEVDDHQDPQAAADDDIMNSQFTFLLQDFHPRHGWYQTWCITELKECHASLHIYAQLHAYFWHGSNFYRDHPEAANELTKAVWESGSYVQPAAQPAEQVHQVASEWKRKRTKFQEHLEHLPFWNDLGERLERVAVECGRHAHPFANNKMNQSSSRCLEEQYQPYRTLTHGDPKQANLFFRKPMESNSVTSEDSSADRPPLDVGLVDFQWSGFGLAASDIAHFMASSVHADLLQQEDVLLQYYYDQLQSRMVQYGVYTNSQEASREYSFEIFLYQYETAILDLARLVIAYTLERFTEAVDKSDSDEKKGRTRNQTSYNKSIPNLIWLVNKCDAILKKRGV